MVGKKKSSSVTDPIRLLEHLSQSLLEHLGQAVSASQTEAEKVLAELEKRRAKVQAKLQGAQEKLTQAAEAGKSKAQAKARASIEELEQLLVQLKARQKDVLGYVAKLKREGKESLLLAKGIEKVKLAAATAIEKRSRVVQEVAEKKPVKAPAKPAVRKPAASVKSTTAATPAASAKVATPAAAKPAPGAAVKKPAPTVAAAKASPARRKAPVAKKPAAGRSAGTETK